MSPDVKLSSTDVLGSMHMVCTIHIPRHVMWVVRLRIACCVLLVRLAALVGGIGIEIDEDEHRDG